MKKLGIVLLSTAILLTGCAANQKSNTSASSSEAKTSLSASDQKALDKATTEYKAFVRRSSEIRSKKASLMKLRKCIR